MIERQNPILRSIPSLSPGITVHCHRLGWDRCMCRFIEESSQEQYLQGVRIHEMGREELKCNAVARETPADLTRSSSVPSGLSCHTARGSARYMPSSTLQQRQVWEVGGGNMWPWARWLSSAKGKSWREAQLGPINHQHCQQLGTESLSLKGAWGSGPQPPPQRGDETCLRSHSQ